VNERRDPRLLADISELLQPVAQKLGEATEDHFVIIAMTWEGDVYKGAYFAEGKTPKSVIHGLEDIVKEIEQDQS
jgi:hypothetical protein